MKLDRIINIVFYKYLEDGEVQTKACVFYRDGSASIVSYEDGILACEAIVKERNITSKHAFQEMINREIIHVMSGEEFVANFDKYVSHDPLDYDLIDEAVAESANEVSATDTPVVISRLVHDEDFEDMYEEEDSYVADEEDNKKSYYDGIDSIYDDATEDLNDSFGTSSYKYNDVYPAVGYDLYPENTEKYTATKEDTKPGFFKRAINKIKESKLATRITAVAVTLAIGLGMYSCVNRKTASGKMLNSNITTARLLDDLDGALNLSNQNTKTTASNKGNSKEKSKTVTKEKNTVTNDNSYYDDYTYEQLLEVTSNETQKQAMKNVNDTLEKFNGEFADAYVEQGIDVRAALSFDEVVALQQAYNDYSKRDIRAIFNGVEIDFKGLSNAFKDANLQLMGAHIIETREHPVDMSLLINSEEGKAYYQRYHEMFLAAKEAKGQDQLAKVKEFFDAVRADFPISEEIRTEGIAHADARNSLRSEQIAVIPMISAAETLFKDLEKDYTLTDAEIDYLNDIGLCNMADEKFRKIETITLNCDKESRKNPTYLQYRDAIVNKLIDKGHYVIDDYHRDLSRLKAFQDAVNWHFEYDAEGYFTGSVYYTTETYTVTKTWTEKYTTYSEKVTRTSKPIPTSEKEKIDRRIEQENKVAKRKGEEKAKENQKRMQDEENRKAKELEEEVERDAKDLQDKIDNANKQIDKNHDGDSSNDKPVNEKDLDHGVDFDDEHSDSKGNLDNSVENITTDPTGDQTGKDLPDPNETGKKFDEKVDNNTNTSDNNNETTSTEESSNTDEHTSTSSESTTTNHEESNTQSEVQQRVEEPTQEQPVQSEPVYEEPTYTEPEPVYQEQEPIIYEPVEYEDGSGYYEEIVSDYVESLANENEVEEAYEYTR